MWMLMSAALEWPAARTTHCLSHRIACWNAPESLVRGYVLPWRRTDTTTAWTA
jgi:hypothetical protein